MSITMKASICKNGQQLGGGGIDGSMGFYSSIKTSTFLHSSQMLNTDLSCGIFLGGGGLAGGESASLRTNIRIQKLDDLL